MIEIIIQQVMNETVKFNAIANSFLKIMLTPAIIKKLNVDRNSMEDKY